TLTEVEGASPEYREFVGELPEVTVTDTRTDVPEGVYWYVTGQASDFVAPAGRTRSPPAPWAGPRASSPTAAGRSLPARRCRPASMGARTRRPRTTSACSPRSCCTSRSTPGRRAPRAASGPPRPTSP